MAKATPEKSAGARAERKAFRTRFRSQIAKIKKVLANTTDTVQVQMLNAHAASLTQELAWLDKRATRYNDPGHPGGLGK